MWWIRRYGLGEVLALVAAVVTLLAVYPHGQAQAALAAAAAEGAAYYAPIVIADLLKARPLTRRRVGLVLAGLATEFGPAEVVDWFVRPAAMYAAASAVPFIAVAAIAGKLVADVAFYFIAVPLYAVVRAHLHPRLELRLEPVT